MDPIVQWTFDDTLSERRYRGPACMLDGLKGIRSGLNEWRVSARQAVSQYLDLLALEQASCCLSHDVMLGYISIA